MELKFSKQGNLKRLTIVLLVYCCASSVIAYGAEWGDVNLDGTVNIVDALMIAQNYVGYSLEHFYSEIGDVNNSGTTDIIDALLVAQYYVGFIPLLPLNTSTPTSVTTPTPTIFPTPTLDVKIQYGFELRDRTADELGMDYAYIEVSAIQTGTDRVNQWTRFGYEISGNAVNGLDYEPIPGELWVPVGSCGFSFRTTA